MLADGPVEERWSEAQILDLEDSFFALARTYFWTRNTVYRPDSFQVESPINQCGPTAFGHGVLLEWKGVAKPSDLFFVEGAVRNGEDGSLIDDKHTWLLRRGRKLLDTLRHTDATLYQYDEFDSLVVRGLVGDITKEVAHLSYCLAARSPEKGKFFTSVIYEPRAITALDEYDTARFNGRLIAFLGSILHPASGLMDHGPLPFLATRMPNTLADDVWLPFDSEMSEEDRRSILAAPRCDAQRWNSLIEA